MLFINKSFLDFEFIKIMDQHPIPQDVTGFQFKLIGTMTVKQFGYVASGVIMAVVLYYMPLNSVWGVLLKVILLPLFGASGIVIAFVPVDGRPIDVMTTNFVKALFSPNQYVYHRQGKSLSFDTVSVTKVKQQTKAQEQQQTHSQTSSKQLDQKEAKLRALLLNSRGQGDSSIDKRETAFLNSLKLTPTPTSPAPSHAAMPVQKAAPKFLEAQHLVAPQITGPAQHQQPVQKFPSQPKNPEELTKKENELTQALSQAQQEERTSNTPATHAIAEQKMAALSKQIQEVHMQKQHLEQELQHLQKQLASQKTPAPAIPTAPKPVTPQTTVQDPQHVRVIPQGVVGIVGTGAF